MRKGSWTRWAALFAGGALLLQTASCAEVAPIMTSFYMWLTAGGVMYIVNRILE